MSLNVDKGKRKFICVEIPEDLDASLKMASGKAKEVLSHAIAFLDEVKKPHVMTEIGKERIIRAGKKILQDNKNKEGIENLDIGFKVLKIED
ncbi:hypothetical protein JHD48_10355 [Sulfurimonas sp. SAG-AH-194-I05]|nr:hypothetical protein [Sulfurimonas sp. SAG-AH-194-I05]